MSFCMNILVGNAETERAFSCQNRIMTKLRKQLKVERLDQLIRLNYAGIAMEELELFDDSETSSSSVNTAVYENTLVP